MLKEMLLLLLFLSFAESLKVITLDEEFERATTANPKGQYNGEKVEGNIEDVSLCFRFFVFFQRQSILGFIHVTIT